MNLKSYVAALAAIIFFCTTILFWQKDRNDLRIDHQIIVDQNQKIAEQQKLIADAEEQLTGQNQKLADQQRWIKDAEEQATESNTGQPDEDKISSISGIYGWEQPYTHTYHQMDFRSDGTVIISSHDSSGYELGGGGATNWKLIDNNSIKLDSAFKAGSDTFKIEGRDLIDSNNYRWIRIHYQ